MYTYLLCRILILSITYYTLHTCAREIEIVEHGPIPTLHTSYCLLVPFDFTDLLIEYPLLQANKKDREGEQNDVLVDILLGFVCSVRRARVIAKS